LHNISLKTGLAKFYCGHALFLSHLYSFIWFDVYIAKKQRGERNNFILHGSGKKNTLVKSMLQYPISPLFVAYQAILMLLSCY